MTDDISQDHRDILTNENSETTYISRQTWGRFWDSPGKGEHRGLGEKFGLPCSSWCQLWINGWMG